MTRLALAFVLLVSLGINAVGQHPTITNPPGPATLGLPPCDGKYFPINKGGSSSCCQMGNELFHVAPTGLAHRTLGPACSRTGAGDVGKCSGTQCYFGPCGAHVEGVLKCDTALVFKPESNPQVCGYQAKWQGVTPTWSVPEPYTDQTLYPAVTASCPFTLCEAGHPETTFTVVITTGTSAIGRVTSDPPGITLSHAGRASGTFEGAVTIAAEPTGKHARAVFSGDCIKTGEYGKKAECSTKLAPDPEVTVTYECEKGFTCSGPNVTP
jgi:hypothetical protein